MTDTQRHVRAHGRHATSPLQLGWRSLWSVAKRIAARVGSDRIGLVSAGVAFFALLALFPGITAVVAIAGLLISPEAVASQLEAASSALPDAARSILLGQVRAVAASESDSLGFAAVASIALALYSASRGVANLIAGLNVTYGEDEARGFIRLTFITLVLTVFVVFVHSLSIAAVAVAPVLLAFPGDNSVWVTALDWLRWPFLLAIGALTFTILYRTGPSRRTARTRWVAPGAVIACLAWLAASRAFAWYVETLGTYAETFGALAGVIVLLLWLWISAFIVLLGALIDAELEAQTAEDSTIGAPRPMGRRGAVKADTCASDTTGA